MKKVFITITVIFTAVLFALCLAGCESGIFLPNDSGITLPDKDDDVTYVVSYSCGKGGIIDGKILQHINRGESATTVTAIPNDGYEFVKWSDGVTDAARTETDVQSDVRVSAKFKRITYNVTYTTDGYGAISGEDSQVVIQGKSAKAVTAIPNEGYEFVKWSDGVTDAARTDTDVRSDISVSAEFQRIFHKLRYLINNIGEGTIEGDAVQYVAYGESGSTIKAVPSEGYEFAYWATSADDEQRLSAERTDNITHDTVIVAYFRLKKVTVKYKAAEGGSIGYIKYAGDIIDYGGQSAIVRAKPIEQKGYVFLYWSDGLKTAERTEYNVTTDMVFTAYFGYSAEYKVNNGVGGKIVGETYQGVLPNEDFKSVEAAPDPGYAFGGWSDLQTDSVRQDTNAERSVEHIAYFEPIIRTFNYDLGIASGIPMESTVTINRENIILDGYPTPEIGGYTFEGWYADSEYKLKAINSDGRYMLGYYGFSLETDTLYARWKPIHDNDRVFKILLVFFNEVKATLYSSRKHGIYDEGPYDVHHLMTTIDREYCALLHDYAINYLCEWLSDLTNVEIDAYFAVYPINEENIITATECYVLREESISETKPLYTSYNSVLSVFSLNNYDGILASPNIVGSAHRKFGCIHLEGFYYSPCFIDTRRIQDHIIEIKTNKMREKEFISTLIHEFIHTCEMCYDPHEIVEMHYALTMAHTLYDGEIEMYRLFLVGQLEYDGQVFGLPKDFWTNKCDEMLPLIRG